ncbi:S41 family peptidase [Schleiferia thermophila]
MKDSKFTYWPIYIAAAVAFGILAGVYITENKSPDSSDLNVGPFSKFKRVLSLIENQYVEKINLDSLLDLTINDLLHRLDPHSTFIDSEHSQEVEDEISGKFLGLGIEFTLMRDTAVVLSILPSSPAEASGLQPGDKILAINQINICEAPYFGDLSKVVALIKKSEKKNLKIHVLRSGNKLNISVQRDWITMPSVTSAVYLPGGVALIAIEKFTENTYSQFLREAKRLRIDTARGLIIDLRDNPGGLLSEAVKITREFLSSNDTIVLIEDRNKKIKAEITPFDGRYRHIPLIVLVNEGSASASEILAGAIQDNSRGLIAGSPTFGKGLVQEESILPDGGRVRITTARYYTPSGRSLQAPYLPEIHDVKTKEIKSHKAKNGNVLLEKGGIQPDIELKNFTNTTSIFNREYLINPNEQMLEYVMHNFSDIKSKGFDMYLKHFDPTYEESLKILGLNPKNAASATEELKEYTVLHVKASIAYMVFGARAGREVVALHDPYIVAAAKTFSKK